MTVGPDDIVAAFNRADLAVTTHAIVMTGVEPNVSPVEARSALSELLADLRVWSEAKGVDFDQVSADTGKRHDTNKGSDV